jgi:murein DD-endopeptidase MepM/ murein hydrolase activator NlpD
MDSNQSYQLQTFKTKPVISTGRKVFTAVFLVSLATNFYFLVWDKRGKSATVAEVAQSAKVVEAVASASPAPATRPAESPKKEAVSAQPVPVSALSAPKGRFHVQKISFAPEKTYNGVEITSLQFKVDGSLNFTLCQIMPAGDCEVMSAYISRQLAWVVDLKRHMRKGDGVSLIYEIRPESQERFKILKLVYKSLSLDKTFEMNFFKSPETKYGSYLNADGTEIAKSIAKEETPIRDYEEITSLPGEFRKGKVHGHAGTDFKAEVGTPVYATFDGEIARVNWNFRANGDCVEIDHPSMGVRTIYLHLSKVDVKPGTRIQRGQKIGESGNTGRSYAPHLHYEIQSLDAKKTIYNPFTFKYHKTYNKTLSAAALEEYKKTVQLYNSFINPIS